MIKKKPIVQILTFLCCAALLPLFVVYKSDSYGNSQKTFAGVALLELANFRYKELTTSGTGVEVLGALGYHFTDKDVTKNFKILQKDANKSVVISAKDAVRKGDITFLEGDVTYERNDGYKLLAQKARYFELAQLVKIDSSFRFDGDKFTAFGDSSDIDLKNKTIGVNSVRAKMTY